MSKRSIKSKRLIHKKVSFDNGKCKPGVVKIVCFANEWLRSCVVFQVCGGCVFKVIETRNIHFKIILDGSGSIQNMFWTLSWEKEEFRLAQCKGYFSAPCTFITSKKQTHQKQKGERENYTNLLVIPWPNQTSIGVIDPRFLYTNMFSGARYPMRKCW